MSFTERMKRDSQRQAGRRLFSCLRQHPYATCRCQACRKARVQAVEKAKTTWDKAKEEEAMNALNVCETDLEGGDE